MKFTLAFISVFTLTLAYAAGQSPEQFFKASGTPVDPKVTVSWNRYYTNEGLLHIYRELVDAHPKLIQVESIGKSYEGRDIWVLTVTNLENRYHGDKPGFWIDGNIHANEIQGSEIALYTAWYLVENYGDNDFITQLMDDKVFYIAPTINPDGRHNYMQEPNTVNTPRSGTVPLDDDGDGEAVEDGFDDLNDDGHITQMRRRSDLGQYREDPDDPRRLIPARAGESGEFELLGYEGIDRDGDGRINEDRTGYYDPNRDWGWNWQPDYVQRGAYLFPFSLPENKAVKDFVISRPNIAGAQSYHNSGGMILRGPGAAEDENRMRMTDRRVYDAIGELGDNLLPGYRYMILFQDLYTVYGGEIDWFHFNRGIYTFTNELMTNYLYFYEQYESRDASQQARYSFDKNLLFEDAFVPWEKFNHPQFGQVEIGGFKKNFGRVHPGFLFEQDAHRNMAFTLHHAYHTPKLEVHEFTVNDIGGGFKEVIAVISNKRLIPTHSGIDVEHRIERPDYITIQGGKVLSGMIVHNRDLNLAEEQLLNPARMEVDNIPGMGHVTIKWIVEGGSKYTLTVDSPKGGKFSRVF
ncbi:MAG: M14 family metallopeptidase [Bacteroidales bacterium]